MPGSSPSCSLMLSAAVYHSSASSSSPRSWASPPRFDLVPELAQAPSELADALGRPQQRPLRIAARLAVDQPLEIVKQRRIALGAPLGAGTRLAHAARRQLLRGVKLAQAAADRVLSHPAGPRDRGDPTTPMRTRLSRRPDPPLTLVKRPGHRPEPLTDRALIDHRTRDSTPRASFLHLITSPTLARLGSDVCAVTTTPFRSVRVAAAMSAPQYR